MRTLKFKSHSSNLMFAHLKLTLGKTRATIIMTQIHKWMEANGPEWTVDRLKSLKVWFLQHLSGNADYSEPWFGKTKRNGHLIPSGAFGPLFSDVFASKHRHNKKIIKVLSALMVYTGVRLEKPSPKQILKTIGSIQGPMLDKTNSDHIAMLGKERLSQLILQNKDMNSALTRFKRRKQKGFMFKPVSLNTGKPFTQGEKYLTSFIQGLHVPLVREYLTNNFRLFPTMDFPDLDPERIPYRSDEIIQAPYSGKIVVIQEAGAKARVVATPSSASQVTLYPLHRMLDEMLRILPTDCTHDQEAGAKWAFNHLANGQDLHSVDLSGATDNFPISLQTGLLEGLGLNDEALLLTQLAKGIWILDSDLVTDLLVGATQIATTYTKGQPQGLYSSFPLFALTHNLLLIDLCSKLGLKPVESFRILGDDIVIANDELNKSYRDHLSLFGVPISEQKSISSNSLGEFAGFVITPEGYFKPAKVPNPETIKPYEHSFVNYLNTVGVNGIKYLPSKVRRLALKVAELPEYLGGLGLNPNGKSLDDRVNDFIEISDVDKDEVPKYFSMEGCFSGVRYSNIPDYAEPALSWLHAQWSLYESHASQVIHSVPTLARLGAHGIAETHSLAYQLSALSGVADSKLLLGNKTPHLSKQQRDHGKPFLTDFDIWSRRFRSLNETDDTPKLNSKVKHGQTKVGTQTR